MDNNQTQKEYIIVPVNGVVVENEKEQTPDTTDNNPSGKFSHIVSAMREKGWYGR